MTEEQYEKRVLQLLTETRNELEKSGCWEDMETLMNRRMAQECESDPEFAEAGTAFQEKYT
jgi:hypothetical protein